MKFRLAKSQVVTRTQNLFQIQDLLGHELYFLIEQESWTMAGEGQTSKSDSHYSVYWVDQKEADRILKENRNFPEDTVKMSDKNPRPGKGGKISICYDDQKESDYIMSYFKMAEDYMKPVSPQNSELPQNAGVVPQNAEDDIEKRLRLTRLAGSVHPAGGLNL